MGGSSVEEGGDDGGGWRGEREREGAWEGMSEADTNAERCWMQACLCFSMDHVHLSLITGGTLIISQLYHHN